MTALEYAKRALSKVESVLSDEAKAQAPSNWTAENEGQWATAGTLAAFVSIAESLDQLLQLAKEDA